MHLVCLIGPPASGKGALGKRLAEQFILAHVSVGDVLRAGRDSGRFEGDQETLSRIANSELLADEKIICILKEEIEKVKQEGYWGMILDGFPRSVKQAALFEEDVQRINLAIAIQCTRETALSRYLERHREQDDEALFDKRYDEYLGSRFDIWFHFGQTRLVAISSEGNTEDTYKRLVDELRKHRLSIVTGNKTHRARRLKKKK